MKDTTNITDGDATAQGSDAWCGADELDENGRQHKRAIAFHDALKWDVLTGIASQHHDGKPCRLHDKFSIGHFNMVKRISFDDGVDWIVRLRLPEGGGFSSIERLAPQRIMEIEVASMKLFKSKTSIPVPAVIAYDSSPDNAAGAPYIIMEYIHGNTAREMRRLKNSAPSFYGTVEQDRKFRRQMAEIQAAVSSLSFPQIGSPYVNADGDFVVGPEAVTGRGPWTTSTDYYDDVVRHIYDTFPKDERRAEMLDSTALFVPSALSFLARVHSRETTGPFRLVNRDFGTQNVLVNDDFDIVGVIDFDGVMAAPIGVVAQHPLFIGFGVEVVDDETNKNPYFVRRIQVNKPRWDEYDGFLRHYEDIVETDSTLSRPSDHLMGREAFAYAGMQSCHCHQVEVNNKWQRACHRMLKDLANGSTVP